MWPQFTIKSHSLAVLVPLVGGLLTLTMIPATRGQAGRTGALWLVVASGAWLFALQVAQAMQADRLTFASAGVGALIAALALRPPTVTDARKAARLFANLTVATSLMSVPISLSAGERQLQWLFTSAFVHPNIGGPILALAFAVSLFLYGRFRFVRISILALMVLSTGSVTSLIGVLVALVYFAIQGLSSVRLRAMFVLACASTPVLAGLVAIRGFGFNGRDVVWSQFLNLFSRNSLKGAGDLGIERALQSGALHWDHGHSQLIDTFGRLGLSGAVPSLALIGLGAVLGIRSWGAGACWASAIILAYQTMGATEYYGSWAMWNLPNWLLVVTLAGVASVKVARPRAPGEG